MFNANRKQLSLGCILAVCLLALLSEASGQTSDSNQSETTTNQTAPPGEQLENSTNQVGTTTIQTNQDILPPESTNQFTPTVTNQYLPLIAMPRQFTPQTALEYQQQAIGAPPPLLGPRPNGSDQLSSPIAGTSALVASPGAASAATATPLVLWDGIVLQASASDSITSTTGIESQPGQQSNPYVETAALSLIFTLGNHWILEYSPSYTMYSGASFENTLANSLVLSGQTTYEGWGLSLAQTYSSSSTPLIETGVQTTEDDYGTTVGASYQLGSQLSVQMSASQNIQIAPQFDNVEARSGTVSLNDQFIPQFGLGVVFSGGYDAISAGSSSPFESISGSLNFQPRNKLSISLTAGYQETQFIHPTAPTLVSPIFSAAVGYQLSRFTSLSLTATRSINPSFFANQVETTTGVTLSVAQELTRKLSLGVVGSYTTEPLTQVVPGAMPQFFLGNEPQTYLVEDYNNTSETVSINLSYSVTTRASLSAVYLWSENSSTQSNYKFTSSQIGLTASYSF
jgi:hypothetical protein